MTPEERTLMVPGWEYLHGEKKCSDDFQRELNELGRQLLLGNLTKHEYIQQSVRLAGLEAEREKALA